MHFALHLRIKVVLVFWIFLLSFQTILSQRVSRNYYTGDWESPLSWDPAWVEPQTELSGMDVIINGYITVNGDLTFFGTESLLTINDTLVIKGDLTLGNNNKLELEDNSILIIWGNFSFHDNSIVAGNSYIIVAGDVIKTGSENLGSFTSGDDPVKLFVGGTISPQLIDDPNYPVFNCSEPQTDPYTNTDCSYGNLEDLAKEPIFDFFQSSCTVVNISNNSPVCEGDDILLTSSGGVNYSWSGPGSFQSNEQNPLITSASPENAGTYRVLVTAASGCIVMDSISVTVYDLPAVQIISPGDPLCINERRAITALPSGGLFTISHGPGNITGNVLQANISGSVKLQYQYNNGMCTNIDYQYIEVMDYPEADAGEDQEFNFIFNTMINAALSPFETGEWSLISGSGQIGNVHSPSTAISNLSLGENIFQWTVSNGACEAVSRVIIKINDLFVPSVITPNADGKNDFFMIDEVEGPVELIIFNQWGLQEFRNSNYQNDWYGRNSRGQLLTDDTYFYILNFENGMSKRGTLLIKR